MWWFVLLVFVCNGYVFCVNNNDCDDKKYCGIAHGEYVCLDVPECSYGSGRVDGDPRGQCIDCLSDNECGWQEENRLPYCWPDRTCRAEPPFTSVIRYSQKNAKYQRGDIFTFQILPGFDEKYLGMIKLDIERVRTCARRKQNERVDPYNPDKGNSTGCDGSVDDVVVSNPQSVVFGKCSNVVYEGCVEITIKINGPIAGPHRPVYIEVIGKVDGSALRDSASDMPSHEKAQIIEKLRWIKADTDKIVTFGHTPELTVQCAPPQEYDPQSMICHSTSNAFRSRWFYYALVAFIMGIFGIIIMVNQHQSEFIF